MGCSCLVLAIGLVFPRIALILIAFFSGWVGRAFPNGLLVPFLGFLFLPYSTLWFTVVMNRFDGQWTLMPSLLMAVAVVLDVSSWGIGVRSRRRRRRDA